MRRQLLLVLMGIVIAIPVVLAIIGTKFFQFQAMAEAGAHFQMPPEPVNVLAAREERWQPRVSSVGSVAAIKGTVLSTETDGVVRAINFQPGSVVAEGDVLVQLDTEVEQAQLDAAKVDAQWAQLAYRRARDLSKTRNIAAVELDSAANSVKQTEAQLRYLKAEMNRKTVRAPFEGRLGVVRISVGRFLAKGSPVVSLQSLDPVFVNFSLPQKHLGELKAGLVVEVQADAYPEQSFIGVITALDPDIDLETRNVRVQATLPNPDGQLRPGMFVSLDVVLERARQAVMIPATAVQYGPRGSTVFVVEEEPVQEQVEGQVGEQVKGNDGEQHLVVRQQPVTLGARRGDFVVVTDGLSGGEQVVSSGVFKLRPGMAVVIDNSLAPEFSLAPNPRNT
ncbi:efflux RND transporter periplasmic adaptor subunit [Marinobacter changyiensis]|uniref:efflux RND transporter periplasmic adaptor subunit n=1 Tax=Marinobacter changyiensis TaxID=2604091 RepID=UPI0012656E10|nr:efflux RND transporter periplasmic adaptor subunit [Marinobacter changyiensis]